MKVYITYDKDSHEIICVHQMPNIDCEICKPIRELKDRNNENNLVEIEKEVMVLSPKTYDSPAILGYYDEKEVLKRREENIVSAEENCPDQCCGIYQEPQYFNPKTKKTQMLFEELTPVWTVCYKNHEVGWKGEAVYITLEAENEAMAKDLAMESKTFTKYIQMKYYKRKYLSAYPAIGNYVIGKVEYYEGDERL